MTACTVFYAAHRDIRFEEPTRFGAAYAASQGRYVAVANLDASDAEAVYARLQNLDRPWAEIRADGAALAPIGPADVDHRRSMSVGDFIVWADGRTEVVASFGFTTFPGIVGRRLMSHCMGDA